MKKNLIVISLVCLLICVGMSGCEELNLDGSTTLSDGTEVTGDIGQIEIIEFNVTKNAMMRWDTRDQQWKIYNDIPNTIELNTDEDSTRWLNTEVEVDWDLNISNIENDMDKRREIYLEYIHSNEPQWHIYDFLSEPLDIEDFTAYFIDEVVSDKKILYLTIRVVSNLRKEDTAIWHITGTAKNIGDDYLKSPEITIHFYNEYGAWLKSTNSYEYDIPSGYTWDFNVKYDGEFSNDVSYISFEVNAN